MIVSGKNKETGAYVHQIYAADNTLFATVEGFDYAETERKAQEVHREALAPIMSGYKMTETDWNDPLLDMSDDDLLNELGL